MTNLKNLQRRQLSASLERLAPLARTARPRRGWVRAIRTTLGMTTSQLAARIGIGQSALSESEKREAEETITLGTLRKVAEGLDCDLVYALVPRTGSLDEILERRAREIARRRVERVSHSMSLEDQAVGQGERERQVEEFARELLDGPMRRLWEDS